jgi:hypothetical protein
MLLLLLLFHSSGDTLKNQHNYLKISAIELTQHWSLHLVGCSLPGKQARNAFEGSRRPENRVKCRDYMDSNLLICQCLCCPFVHNENSSFPGGCVDSTAIFKPRKFHISHNFYTTFQDFINICWKK